jgi:hypothetical protein
VDDCGAPEAASAARFLLIERAALRSGVHVEEIAAARGARWRLEVESSCM